jgi:DNA polymerase (family 10)
MRGGKGIVRMELCGSLRRRKETIKDIDILISSNHPGPLMERFVNLPFVERIVAHGPTKSSVVANDKGATGKPLVMNADLRIVTDDQFAFALNYFTGSKEHNVALRGRAQDMGLKLNEYELAGEKRSIPCKEEEGLYRALGLAYVPPELRENTGEIEAAETGKLPHLVEADEVQGVFHCHTNWSDGTNTLEEMANAAKKLGLRYLGLGDHSPSLTVANGLTPDRVYKQQKEIDALNKKLKGIKLFKGIECDILADGRLDYDDEVLASFDYVVASVHSHFNQPAAEMTARICRALRHPRVTMLGHATGRLLLRRDGYAVDLDAVLQEASKHKKMIEINAHPMRLDLDWIHCKRAKALGIKLVINPDAHSTSDLAYYRYGVDVARRGWLEREDVFNTLSAAQVAKRLAAPK